MNQNKRPLPSLTSIRFFLALWVVVYHQIPDTPAGLAISWLPGVPDWICCIVRTGYIAVTVFFVLSGFVLAYNYDLSQHWNFGQRMRFGIARFSRIYPAYFIGLAALAPLAVYRGVIGVGVGPVRDALTAVLNAVLLQAWYPLTALTWNYPGWSLCDEAFFYATMPVLGILLWRIRRPRWILAAAAGCWLLSLAAPLAAVIAPIPGFGDAPSTDTALVTSEFWANLIRYNPPIRLPEFCAGILLAALYRSLPPGHRLFGRGYWLYLPAGLLSLTVLSLGDRIPYPLVHNGLLLPLYACGIFGLAVDGGVLAKWLSARPLVFLGNASYSMYILHVPIQLWLMISLKHLLDWKAEGMAWVAGYSVAVIVLSSCFYYFVEDPLHRMTKKKLDAWLLKRRGPRAEVLSKAGSPRN